MTRRALVLLAALAALVAPGPPALPVAAQEPAPVQEPTAADGDHGVDRSAPPGVDGADAVATPRTAYSAELERRTSELAAELRCPVCQGVSVEDSPTELARQMRAVVREQLAAGRTPDEVRQYFVDKYGEWILLEPKASGFNLVVYILPWLALLAGLALILFTVRRWTRAASADAAPETPASASAIDS